MRFISLFWAWLGAFHLLKISGISGSAVNGIRFVGSSHWKIPRKSGKSKVHGRAPPRTGVYDQMEQRFTNRKFHFCYHRNFRVFFLNGKRPIVNKLEPVTNSEIERQKSDISLHGYLTSSFF